MINVNTLPRITWRWIKTNSGETQIPEFKEKPFSLYQDNIIEGEGFGDSFKNMKYGVSEEVLKLNENLRNWTNDISLKENEELEKKYDINIDEENNLLVDLQQIHMREGSKATIIYNYTCQDDLDFFKDTVFKIKAEKNSYLQLVLVQKLSHKGLNFTSLVSSIDEGAKVELIEVDLGGKETYTNYVVDLLAPNAESKIASAYFVDEDRVHDINYQINHIGKSTVSDLRVNGALKDRARKRFSGTIDFRKGSSGSVGNEEEFVTLMDEPVKSIAVPLLLAAEHDIMGNHAASAGRIDSDILIYLMSRGLNESEARSIAVEAKITPTLDLIPDEEIRSEVKEFIHKGIIE